MLKQRVLTAAILIPIVLSLIYFLSPANFCIFTAIILALGSWEWARLIGLKKATSRLAYVFLIVLTMIITLFIRVPNVLYAASYWWFFAFLCLCIYQWRGQNILAGRFTLGLVGILVLIPSWVAINYIRNESDGFWMLLYLLVLIWGADSFAYFAGKKWGKNRLASKISPGKSIEGVIGALIFCVVFTAFVLWMLSYPANLWLPGFIISFITVIFSIIGDLFESLIKRHANVKDSGTLIPGHGGLLDRIDSLTAAAPIFVTVTLVVGKYFSY